MRCWRAKTDGWAASTFHSNCDGKGPTVTIIQVGRYIFGGYTDVSWFSGEYHFISTAGFFHFVSYIHFHFWQMKTEVVPVVVKANVRVDELLKWALIETARILRRVLRI